MTRLSAFVLTLGSLLLGFALCVGLVLWQGIGAAEMRLLRAGFSPLWSALVLLLTAALMFCGERKWAVLSAAWHGGEGAEPAKGFFRRHYLWQTWMGQFVPPSLAIVLGRGWAARAMRGVGALSGVTNGLFDQATDFALLCAFLPAGALVLWAGAGWGGFIWGSCFGVALVALLGKQLFRWTPASLRESYWSIFGWSLARVALTLLRLLAGVYAFGFSLSLLAVSALTPVVGLLALLPLTPGNLGLAEWGWVGGLVFAGESAHDAALYALGFRVLVLVAQTILLGLNEAHVLHSQPNAALRS